MPGQAPNCLLQELTYGDIVFPSGNYWFCPEHLSLDSVSMVDYSTRILHTYKPGSYALSEYDCIILNSEIGFWRSYLRGSSRTSPWPPSCWSARSWFQWGWVISVKSLTIQLPLSETEGNFDIEACVRKQLDKQQLIWPHPAEQTP